ncbi:type I-E CRISPR-associated protein Cas5/CasD [Deinococcus aetherius]|uniref:Type I-E CRISPR-associated protein Cas5/CasD n=1 Tax=Deinococcus aetherius TaxID=200252 RepID=A0ABN6RLV0_9DEIO|nr:type I-E CRISPR-associated protein Cas5/CasD [Deinococcus aetherius]BDP42577.1 type I-E CRISPR-associated protein Cas5/CasD [Deinococcus aetherius]
MATLLIRLVGPMQAWGTRSQFDDRDTEAEPSKSGVLGLVAAALGIDRAEPVDHLAALRFGVRVDREGVVRSDYHTAQLFPGERKTSTSVTRRAYLVDAAFWAALGGERPLLEATHAALRNPHWPLCLGRKSFPPSEALWLDGGVREGELLDVLRSAPSLRGERNDPDAPYRFVVDRDAVSGDTRRLSPGLRRDDPTASFAERRYALRDVWMFSEAPMARPAPLPEVG